MQNLYINILHSFVLMSSRGFHYFIRIYFNIILPTVARFSKWPRSFTLPLKIPVIFFLQKSHISSQSHFLVLIIPITCSERYKSWSLYLQNFLHPHLISLKFPNIFSAPYPRTPCVYFIPIMRENKFYDNVKQLRVYSYICQDVDVYEDQGCNMSNNNLFLIFMKEE
jgi:hypothetical protein